MFLRGEPYEPHSVDHARSLGIDTVYQDLALIDELSVFQNMFLRREQRPPAAAVPRQPRDAPRDARGARRDRRQHPAPRTRPSRGCRAASGRRSRSRARVHSEADILLLDEPLAAMGAKEGAMILDLIAAPARPRAASRSSWSSTTTSTCCEACDRVNLIQDGEITLDKPTAETSVEELTEIVVERVPARAPGGARARSRRPMTYVVGIDFGTLSARALVVRARDGAELGLGGARVPARGDRAGAGRPPAPSSRRSGRCRIPPTTSTSCATRCPAAVGGGRRSRPSEVVGIATDFTARTPLPVLRRRHAAVPGAGVRATGRTPTPKLWKHHAAQRHADRINARRRRARRAVARALRRADLVGVGVRQGAAGARGGPGDLRAHATAGSRRADWIVWQLCGRETRNACTAGYKGIYQDGRYPSEDFLRALDERFADFVAAKLDGRRCRRSAPAPAASPRRPRRGPGCPRASRSRSATSTRTSPRPPPRRSTRARCSR